MRTLHANSSCVTVHPSSFCVHPKENAPQHGLGHQLEQRKITNDTDERSFERALGSPWPSSFPRMLAFNARGCHKSGRAPGACWRHQSSGKDGIERARPASGRGAAPAGEPARGVPGMGRRRAARGGKAAKSACIRRLVRSFKGRKDDPGRTPRPGGAVRTGKAEHPSGGLHQHGACNASGGAQSRTSNTEEKARRRRSKERGGTDSWQKKRRSCVFVNDDKS